jgi:hypothetical protein
VCAARTVDSFRIAPHHRQMITITCAAPSKKVPFRKFWIDARGVRQSVAWLMPSDRNRSNPVDRASLILKFKAY